MHSHELTVGRTVGVVFDHGDDFYTALDQACRSHGIRQGYIPMFIAGFRSVDIVGTCERLEDPDAPVWSKVQLSNVEALGGGTLAYNPETDSIEPHIHVTVGLKAQSGRWVLPRHCPRLSEGLLTCASIWPPASCTAASAPLLKGM